MSDADSTELRKLFAKRNEQISAFVKDKNWIGLSELYTENGTFLVSGALNQGRQEIEEFNEKQNAKSLKLSTLNLDVSNVQAKIVIEVGKSELTRNDGGIHPGIYLVVWKQVDEQWLIDYDVAV